MIVHIHLVNGTTVTDQAEKGEGLSEYAHRKLDSANMNNGFIFFKNDFVNAAHIVSMNPAR